MSPFEEACPHVNVEYVQGAEGSFQVGSDAAPLRVICPGNIHVPRREDRPPAQDRVTVRYATAMSIAAKGRVHAERFTQHFYLTVTRVARRENFLQRDDVGVKLGKHLLYSLDRN